MLDDSLGGCRPLHMALHGGRRLFHVGFLDQPDGVGGLWSDSSQCEGPQPDFQVQLYGCVPLLLPLKQLVLVNSSLPFNDLKHGVVQSPHAGRIKEVQPNLASNQSNLLAGPRSQ